MLRPGAYLTITVVLVIKGMSYPVTREQIRQARRAPLADYLLSKYPSEFKSVGTSIYQRSNPSLYVKKSVPGYHDFSTGAHGNSVDFLIQYKGMSFNEAVLALCGPKAVSSGFKADPAQMNQFALPQEGTLPFSRVCDYLTNRAIPSDCVEQLIKERLLYEDSPYGNAVFVNPQKDYCEIRGTGQQKFHGCRKLKPDRFWYILNGSTPPTCAYICESAIDAVSLMIIQHLAGYHGAAVYISIGGVGNQQTIDRIKTRISAVLAVDNDAAGQACRARNPEMMAIIPRAKDWNDDLCAMET